MEANKMRARFFNRRNLAVVFLALAVALIFSYLGRLHDINAWIGVTFGDLIGYNYFLAGAVFFFLSVVASMLSFFTSVPLIPVAVTLWGKGITFWLLLGGWMIGAVLGYYLAFAVSPILRRFSIFQKIDRYRRQLDGTSEFLLVTLFRLAVPGEIGIYTLGLLRYPFWKHLVISFIADLPFAILAIYSSTALVGTQPMNFVLLMIVGLLIISVTAYFFHLRLKKLHPDKSEEGI